MPRSTPTPASGGPGLFDLVDARYDVPGRAILGPVSLRLEPGHVYGLVGPNGSGKSTLMLLLARDLAATGGEVRFGGLPAGAWGERGFARRVAFMPQFTPPADGLNVRELVALGRYPWHGMLGRFTAADVDRVEAAIHSTGLEALAERAVDTLSGGERQRAWLAVMLAQDTEWLLLDEPTSALDLAHQEEILRLVHALSRERGLSVVVVLHDINLAARYCDEIVALGNGRIVARAPAGEIMRPERLSVIYGLPMGVFAHPVSGAPIGYVA
ncbi:Iron(3+)-hydroxamate import ATP-binding protein FhuC [Starkeya nomas]|uniref:Iron(3+)-hydroxamate import ATP-binding protein FhuC n=1 Tax=Starkeya nomas TaxID=2666134 RepID=A0A5S9NQW2_9HYPH|nr:ATP-binding cassette domain-containing protein [Starkeya nomas]CAA0092917.1 Iron(3+)-hydroxamate import ATP-binding protein FhuC [Starkeya nomas]